MQRERLFHIDFKLYFLGELRRADVVERFETAPAGATRDIAQYREIAPENLELDSTTKTYRPTPEFVPLFEHQPQRVLWPFSALHGQEHGIHAGQALHRNTPLVDHGFVAAITYPRLRFRQLLLPSQRDRNSRPISGSPTIRNPATKCTRLAVSFFGQLSQRCLPAIPLLGKYILCAITSAPRRIHRCRAPCRVLRDSRSTSSRSTRPLRR